ncbi:MAG: hypothetical protein ABIJ08_07010 [Nanoarchaeota archaeon]
MNKRADGGLTAIVIIIIIVLFLSWLVNLGYRECRSNKECSSEEYCGSDFACHKIPIIEKETTPIVIQKSYVGPAWIIGIAMIIASVLFNIEKILPLIPKKNNKQEKDKIYTNVHTYYEKQSSK